MTLLGASLLGQTMGQFGRGLQVLDVRGCGFLAWGCSGIRIV